MADNWHIRWLAEGVKKWNKRRKKVAFRPDLSGVRFFDLLPWDFRDSPKTSRYFEKIDLSDADLSGADLSGLNFAKADFERSDLSSSNLSLSNFTKADFSNAKLTDANATHAIFIEALFVESDLTRATLEDSDARGAVLVNSRVTENQISSLADKRLQQYSSLSAYNEVVKQAPLPIKLRESPGIFSTPVEPGAGLPTAIRSDSKTHESTPRYEEHKSRTGKNRYDVFFGTNRAPVIERGAVIDFGDSASQDLSFGVCEVLIPDGHRVGSIGSPLWKRILNRADDRLKLDTIISLNDKLFWEHLHQTTARMRVKEKPTIFIHGYNTSFVDAALRAAQIGFDLGIGQGVGLFSWPSKASKKDYLADEAASESSKYQLANFIEQFIEESDQKSVNLIAHSMGCRCVLNAIEVLSNGRRGVLSKVNQVILAAADVDSKLMPNLAKYSLHYCKRTTSYVCGDDLALKISGWLHGYARVGFRPPTFVLGGMDTIVVNDKDLGDFSHGYVGTSRVVLNDVFTLLKANTPPAERFSIENVVEGGDTYWRLKD